MKRFRGVWRKHPRSRYPRNWPQIATRAKKREGWRCERCRHPQDPSGEQLACDSLCRHEPVAPGTSTRDIHRVLTVHHIDGNRANNQWWNLAVLCQRCHLAIQGKVDFEQGYLLDHSEWFVGHMQGFLRDKIHRELHARQASADRSVRCG